MTRIIVLSVLLFLFVGGGYLWWNSEEEALAPQETTVNNDLQQEEQDPPASKDTTSFQNDTSTPPASSSSSSTTHVPKVIEGRIVPPRVVQSANIADMENVEGSPNEVPHYVIDGLTWAAQARSLFATIKHLAQGKEPPEGEEPIDLRQLALELQEALKRVEVPLQNKEIVQLMTMIEESMRIIIERLPQQPTEEDWIRALEERERVRPMIGKLYSLLEDQR